MLAGTFAMVFGALFEGMFLFICSQVFDLWSFAASRQRGNVPMPFCGVFVCQNMLILHMPSTFQVFNIESTNFSMRQKDLPYHTEDDSQNKRFSSFLSSICWFLQVSLPTVYLKVLLTIVGALALGRALEQSCLAKCNLPGVWSKTSGFCGVQWPNVMACFLFVFVERIFWHFVLIIYPHRITMRLFVQKSLAFSSIATLPHYYTSSLKMFDFAAIWCAVWITNGGSPHAHIAVQVSLDSFVLHHGCWTFTRTRSSIRPTHHPSSN